jgi:hypothetical protein
MLAALGLGNALWVPPVRFRGQKKFSDEEVKETRKVANLRIHVERAMKRIKAFRCLRNTVTITQTDLISDIFFVCAMLSNYQHPLCSY